MNGIKVYFFQKYKERADVSDRTKQQIASCDFIYHLPIYSQLVRLNAIYKLLDTFQMNNIFLTLHLCPGEPTNDQRKSLFIKHLLLCGLLSRVL